MSVTQSGQDRRAALALEGVSFDAGTQRVTGVTVAVGPSETVALQGPTGAGKTTLLRVLAGVHPISCGGVYYSGRDGQTLTPQERMLSWVPQGGGLFPHLSVRKQIAFVADARQARELNVAEHARRWGIGHLLDREPQRLSGGEKQLVALARATSWRPQGLLLDEPFAALSAARRAQAFDALNSWRSEGDPLWVIHVTHRQDEAVDATQRWNLQDGHLQVD